MTVSQNEGRQSPQDSRISGRVAAALIALLVLLVAVVVVAVLAPSKRLENFVSINPDAYAGIPADGLSLGAPTAPVTIVEYSDFQCPYCKEAEANLVRPMINQFVREGVVRFEYRPMAFIGNESVRAAEASLCADDQGQFWLYHDVLFANQQAENSGGFSDERLKGFAAELDLDEDRFNECLDQRVHQAEVEAVLEEASSNGVQSTPSFFVNGELIAVGVVSYSDLQQAIIQAMQ